MPQERNAFKVGFVLVISLAAFLAVIVWLPSNFSSEKMQPLSVRFPHIYRLPQLDPGSAVVVGGQRVGGVKQVRIEDQPVVRDAVPPRLEWYVIVDLEVRDALRLRADCSITPEGPPLGGPGLLILTLGSDEKVLQPGTIIEGSIPGGFSAVVQSVNTVLGMEMDANNPHSMLGLIKRQLDESQQASLAAKLHQSMDDFNAVSRAVRLQFDDRQKDALLARLIETMDNLNRMTGALREQMSVEHPAAALAKVHVALDALNSGLRGVQTIVEESRTPIQTTLTHLSSTAETVDKGIVGPLAEQMDKRNAAGLLAKINVAADRVNATLRNVNDVSQTARDVALLNRDNLNEMLRNLKQTSEHVKSAVKFVLRRPWLLFNEPTLVETKQKDILDAASHFQDAAARLDDATAELRALSELHNGNIPEGDSDLKRIRVAIDDAFKRFKDAEASLWKNLDVK